MKFPRSLELTAEVSCGSAKLPLTPLSGDLASPTYDLHGLRLRVTPKFWGKGSDAFGRYCAYK
ncbi:hypothetical protein SAMD00023353_6400250 [Rosellinia necatrix]|uniref:Uncharacterized protein n=1 Tax=Rosellinia necatrix TaxID=77044 RepID=A0A1S8AAA5_ROSNE|nr:hypothetical protein SAMD00023353_6400250 [Rosellinia necatrix]